MEKQNGITLVTLVVTIIILIILAGISVNSLVGENGIITKAKEAKQNIILAGEAEALQLNQLYYELEIGGELTEDEELAKKDEIIAELQKELEDIKTKTNATADKILSDYTAYSGGELLTGTMANRGAVSSNLNCGESYIIPAGYHDGSGIVTARSLESQTQATATAEDILLGKTAYVNGNEIIGSMKSDVKSQTVSVTYSITAYTALKYTLTFDQLTEIIGISYMTTNDPGVPFYGDASRSIKFEGNVVSGYVRENDNVNESFTLTITAIGY